jgi:hypothetical protein
MIRPVAAFILSRLSANIARNSIDSAITRRRFYT